jgi:hypothetical protein
MPLFGASKSKSIDSRKQGSKEKGCDKPMII